MALIGHIPLFLVLTGQALAVTPTPSPSPIVNPLSRVSATGIPQRVEGFSGLFLGAPYFDGALGEGDKAEFDRKPVVRYDMFDCETYLETVVALSISSSERDFAKNLKRIRYRSGRVSFGTRNHFPDLDWIPNNIRNGILEDITAKVAADKPLSLATTTIDRKAWYGFMSASRLYLPEADDAAKQKALERLHALGKNYKPEKSEISYIPFEVLFPQTRKTPDDPLDPKAPADEALFHRIPSGAIVSIVRPNWNVTKLIGTRMNVSHQGFLIWKKDVLTLRHAKSEVGKHVCDEPFIDYLRRAMAFKSIHGIHLLQVRSAPPVNSLATTKRGEP